MSRERSCAAPLPWLLLVLAGCGAPQPKPQQDLLAFLDQGRVTRDEVHAHLGPPSAAFERDNIITYRLGHSSAGYVVVPPDPNPTAVQLGWRGVDYDLVLAFNDDGTLREHRLVAVRIAPPQQ